MRFGPAEEELELAAAAGTAGTNTLTTGKLLVLNGDTVPLTMTLTNTTGTAVNNVAPGAVTVTATNGIGTSPASAPSNRILATVLPQMYYIHADHLSSPRQITDAGGTVVWQWDNADPFGNNVPNENPNGAGQFSFPLRFPGQYADKETNTYYNVNRDYDPSIGRYVESDPIGLAGGINTYGYAFQNPLRFIDPTVAPEALVFFFQISA